MSPKLTLVVAVARNGVIGRDGALPWRLKSDMARFKAATMGKPVLMGRKTWDSLFVRPLPGRKNLVLTRDASFRPKEAWAFTKLDAFLAAGRAMAEEMGVDEYAVIGGSLLYAETLPLADRLRYTEVALDPEGDARFPKLDPAQWIETSREEVTAGAGDEADFAVRVLDRRR
ncbi:MAG: dihydrofolate reductase [Hyphomonadaceae bacterium]|nr:dihydrofolate reductase [Hyphomonadaceae bacterium]